MIHAIEVEVIHELIITIKLLIHKTDIALQVEMDLVMTKILLLHKLLDRNMTTKNEIHDPIVLLTDLFTDPLTDRTLVIERDLVHIQQITTILQDTNLHINHLHDQEILDNLEHVHIPLQEVNLIQYIHNTKTTQLISRYTCIIQLK